MSTDDLASRTKEPGPLVLPATEPTAPGIQRQPYDNPARAKPTYGSDEECAQLLTPILRQVPRDLSGDNSTRFPLLDALRTLDAARGTDAARELTFVAAVTHRTADERRTAEYLLRNRQEVTDGRRSAISLLLAARCAAELDVRRVWQRETSLPRSLAAQADRTSSTRAADRSTGDMVLDALRAGVGEELISPAVAELVLDAVAIALEIAARHALNNGKGPAVLGMRTDARKASRLVTHLRREWGNGGAARNMARLLVGADGTPIETALLCWSVRRNLTTERIPAFVRDRWRRYLRAAAAATSASASYPQTQDVDLARNRTAGYKAA